MILVQFFKFSGLIKNWKHDQGLNINEENPIFRSNVGQIIPKTNKCGGGGGVGGVAIPTGRPTNIASVNIRCYILIFEYKPT